MITYQIKKIKPYGDDREINAFIIEPPHQGLNVIKGFDNLDDLNLEIDWLKELTQRNVPDFSEDGIMINQPFLWGSQKSKTVEISADKKFTGTHEFDTKELIEVFYAWVDFLKK